MKKRGGHRSFVQSISSKNVDLGTYVISIYLAWLIAIRKPLREDRSDMVGMKLRNSIVIEQNVDGWSI